MFVASNCNIIMIPLRGDPVVGLLCSLTSNHLSLADVSSNPIRDHTNLTRENAVRLAYGRSVVELRCWNRFKRPLEKQTMTIVRFIFTFKYPVPHTR